MTKSANISVEEKLAFLRDHLAYEREMLGHAFSQLHALPAGLAWNANYESFAVHARNLYDFLRNDGKQKNFKAFQFVPDWAPPKFLDQFNGLDPFVFHMGMERGEATKLDLATLGVLGTWLDQHWKAWVNRLPQPFSGEIADSPVCPVLVMTGGATPQTACTAVFATTLHIPS